MNQENPKDSKMRHAKGRVPLERALSKLGLASRGETRIWVLAGRLAVNGRVITDPQWLVHPESSLGHL